MGDFLIDDNPSVNGSQQPLWTQILFDAPYNATVELGWRRRLHHWENVEDILSDELTGSVDLESEGSDECSTRSGMQSFDSVNSFTSITSVTPEEVAHLRDFSNELKGSTYTKDYMNWRKGYAKGAKGDFHQAVAEIDAIRKQMFLEGDDWSSVHSYRRDYQNWRKGSSCGAKGFDSAHIVMGAF